MSPLPPPPAALQHCLPCHRVPSPSGGIRLDRPLDFATAQKVRAALRPESTRPMPPSGPLPPPERKALEQWAASIKPEPPHWAFVALTPAPLPKRGPSPVSIDTFLLAKLQAKGLGFSPEADRRTLLRRVTFDLTGLPPTPEQVAAFVGSKDPRAYEKLVDRLLAAPAYGERWGRHWLDVVHYADTHGYDKDKRRDNAWPYRDWVIRALNADLPYPEFVQRQVAGDVLWPETPDGIIPTGFLVAGPWDFVGQVELAEGTVEKEKTRLLDRDDLVANTLSTFASVTVHCARCHDHKFDPIPQRDYYRLQAVFAGIERGERVYAESAEPTSAGSPSNGYHSGIEKTPDATKWVQLDLGIPQPLETLRLIPAHPTDFADTPGFGFPLRFRVEVDGQVVADQTRADVPNPGAAPWTLPLKGVMGRVVRITATRLWPRTGDFVFALAEVQVWSGGRNRARGATVTALDSIEQGRWSTRFLTDGFDSRQGYGQRTYAALPRVPRPIAVLARGEVEQPREPVGPGALFGATFANTPDEGARRVALARWLTARENPLFWRSIVNRVWQYHFGRGIVETPNDFGKNGARPTHPELLDALALWFRDDARGSLKQLHRLIVTSRAYRQSAQGNALGARRDADNRLLWRQNRRRLEAEEVRDSVLAVSGTLDRTPGGPGFALFTFKDDHSPVYDHTSLTAITDPKTFRRTVYRFTVRSVPNPLLDCLDCADPSVNTPVRNTTLTALQSLALLNDPFLIDQAEHFARRLRQQSPRLPQQVTDAFRLALGRSPSAVEHADALGYVQKHGLENLCRLLFNTSEFVFVD